MQIELHKISVKEIINGYLNNEEEGVVGYSGQLNIRPKYQREFVYKDDKRNAVIETIWKNFPLNVMYWAKNEDGSFEVLDGQQRTISICEYCNNNFSILIDNNPMYFHSLTDSQKETILNYKLMIYFCEGTDEEKLDWFKIINIAGEKLTDQELRNAVYTGSWLSDAKLHFSKNNCAAYRLSKDYVNGSPIRQEILETALDWISKGKIKEYMASHQHDENANELWQYFQSVIHWITTIYTKYHKDMKGVDWGTLHRKYSVNSYNPADIEAEVSTLYANSEVDNKKGIFEFVLKLNRTIADDRLLSKRVFDDTDKATKYEQQKHKCAICGEEFELENMHGDHITPWSAGGRTVLDNLQMLCRDCNLRKSAQAL